MASYLRSLFGLDGRVALVTGGGSGLGRQIALALAGAGAKVVVLGRRQAMLAETVEAVRCRVREGGGDAESCSAALDADIACAEEIVRVVAAAPKHFGAPDILVNAAGVNNRIPAADMTADDWQRAIDLNLRAPFLLARGLVEAEGGMGASGRGSIINIGSLQSLRAGLGDAAYGASKGGVAQLTRSLGREWGMRGVRVNTLIPGFFPTAMTGLVWKDEELKAKLAASTLLGRNGELADVEGAAVFLASDASAYITGCCLPLDGGFLAR